MWFLLETWRHKRGTHWRLGRHKKGTRWRLWDTKGYSLESLEPDREEIWGHKGVLIGTLGRPEGVLVGDLGTGKRYSLKTWKP